MSQNPLRAGPLSDDVPPTEDRNVIDTERGPAGNRNPVRRPALRARPQSWHPYGPVEPRLAVAQSRSIGVHAILNPPAQAPAEAAGSSREPVNLPPPSTSPRPRQGSLSIPRPGQSIVPQALSPRSHPRPLMNPGSPSARFVSGGRTSGQASVAQSPFISQEASMGPRQSTANSPASFESVLRPITSLPGTQAPPAASIRATPSLHSRQTSVGPGPLTNPNSQETSPNLPPASFSQIGHASPAVTQGPLPPSGAPYSPAAYMTMDQVSRGLPATTGPRLPVEESAGLGVTTQNTSQPGLIPCVLDLKSGSVSQAEKRKANSDASRRFRNRKRNEMQLEQRLNAQQEEIQRHAETLQRQSEEIRALVQQRDHYRAERDFYRGHLGRTMPISQLPPRPPSPRLARPSVLPPSVDTPSAPTWPAQDASRSTSGSQPGSAGPGPSGAHSSWPSTPASYSPAPLPPDGRGIASAVPPPLTGSPLPPLQGAWSRP